MEVIEMANTTLRQVFSDIADSIRAKGVTGTMTPLQMAGRIGSIRTSKYGVSGDSVLGDVNSQGELQPPSQTFQFSSSDIRSIPEYGLYFKFYNNPALTSVNLPSLTNVGNYGLYCAFQNCTSLTSISFPNLAGISLANDPLYGICRGCTSLTSVNLPNLTNVGSYGLQYAFYGCTSLTSVNLSSLTTTLTREHALEYAFQNCTSLTTVDLSSLTKVGSYGLKSTFQGCTSLTSVYLSTLTSVGLQGMDNAFYGCTHLELVDFSEATSVTPLSSTSAFSSTNNTYQIVVPDDLYSSWITASNWSSISSHIVKASEYTPAS